MFDKFKDGNGNFNETITSNVHGLLSLYEASHIRVHGDELLDNALAFSTNILRSMVARPGDPLAVQVLHALKQPLHKGMPRLESRYYIDFYEKDPLHSKILLEFAKLDFNLVQALHKEELRDLTRWWRNLNVISKLPFMIRDRVTEGYFWSLRAFYEPQYSLGRIIFLKVFKIISIIDDIYDAYGTIEELKLFTQAIERWDRSCIDEIPKYMKVGYQPLLDIFEEFKMELAKEGRSHYVQYAKEEVKAMCQAYLREAKWREEKEKAFPTLDEYLNRAAIVSFGYNLATTVCFLGMGQVATKDSFDWVSKFPKAVRASGVIGRLMDDMGSRDFEQSRDHVPSAVECYMREHSTTAEDVKNAFQEQVESSWKDINEAMLRPHVIPQPLLTRILNLCRVVDVIYKGEDSYTFANGTMKDNIAMILTDPIPM